MPYFPNGSDPSAVRFAVECLACPHGEAPCPVALVMLTHNYDQCGNEKLTEAMDLLVADTGECKMKGLIVGKKSA